MIKNHPLKGLVSFTCSRIHFTPIKYQDKIPTRMAFFLKRIDTHQTYET